MKIVRPRPNAEASEALAARMTEFDRHIGGRIRQRRTALGMTQHDLAAMVGIAYRSVNMFECGVGRISAGYLLEIATALSVPVAWFFDGIEDPDQAADAPQRLMSLELARNFLAIENVKHRNALRDMARTLAAQSSAKKVSGDTANEIGGDQAS